MIGQTLYAKYILEREDAKIIENADGFLIYRIVGQEAFIVNLFVDSKSRKKGICEELVSILEKKAIEQRCDHLSGLIQINDPGRNVTMQAALRIGFEIAGVNPQSILIIKKITSGGNQHG